MRQRISKNFIYGLVCGVLTALFLMWGVFGLWQAYIRAWHGLRDLGTSIAFYLTEMFGFKGLVSPTVITVPTMPVPAPGIPETPEAFQSGWARLWPLLINKDNLAGYFGGILRGFGNFMMWVALLLPFAVLFVILFRRSLLRENNDYNKDSRPLRAAKKLATYTYIPAKNWLAGFIAFIREHAIILKLWLVIALLNFNALAIVLELFAYLLYFSASFNFGGMYTQVYKLFLDLRQTIATVPPFLWFVIGYAIFLWVRRNIGYGRLFNMELRNRAFIAALPVSEMQTGSMGTGKTQMTTDMSLSAAVMFRDEALDQLVGNSMKFPNFPWINFENELRRGMWYHKVYNLATCKRFVIKKALRWNKAPARQKLFDYDFERYGLTYDDKLQTTELFDVLSEYAKAYFIYVVESSLLLSNYSIRTDGVKLDAGNLPMWNNDFFRRDSKRIGAESRYAHIVDFDMLRLGKKVIDNNMKQNAFEFGIVIITEVGKERGNQIENRGKKKDDDGANQLNDGFNRRIKMIRHSATVGHYCFVKILMDDQRDESLGADARQLCEIVHIREKSEKRLALPFFFLEELLYDFLFARFKRFFLNYRFARGDNTLVMHLLKKLAAALHAYYTRTYNVFGYNVLQIEKERGTKDGALEELRYYLCFKKIYSQRYATDAYSDYFDEKSERSAVGLADLQRYGTYRAKLSELQLEGSYFVNELSDDLNGTTAANIRAEQAEREAERMREEAKQRKAEEKERRKIEASELARLIVRDDALTSEAMEFVKDQYKKQKDIAAALEGSDEFFEDMKRKVSS